MTEAFGLFAGVKFRSLSIRPAAASVACVSGLFDTTIYSGEASRLLFYAIGTVTVENFHVVTGFCATDSVGK
jgi:hypothetical protein